MSNHFFTYDITNSIKMLLPPKRRKSKLVSFLIAISTGIKEVKDDLLSFRTDTYYELNFSMQRIVLEHYLNDQFDSVNRLIKVETIPSLLHPIWHNKDENRILYLYNKSETITHTNYYYNKSEQGSSYKFKVLIPDMSIQNSIRWWIEQRNIMLNEFLIEQL
jgi:hypothetical protein